MPMRRLVAFLSIAIATAAWLAWPAPGQALVNATISVTSSPNPSVTFTTIKIVIKFAAPVTDIRFWLARQGGYNGPNVCTPACEFFSPDGAPTWVLASASGTVTATFLTDARPGATDLVYHDGFSADLVSLREKLPTIKTTLARKPTGAVMPGDTLHVTVKSTTNAGPLTDSLYVWLPAGVGNPLNLPEGATYHPPPTSMILVARTLNKSGGYEFDVPIAAPIGTKLVFKASFGFEAWDKGTTMSFVVGVAPTPRPTATPKATKQPQATPAATIGPSNALPPSSSPSITDASPSPSPTAAVSTSPTTSDGTPTPMTAPTAAPGVVPAGVDVGGGFVAGLAVVLGIGLGSLAMLRLVARRRQVPGPAR
jgi:hypothetical protein